ncbi:MAG: isoleucyl-tRNA synthetase [Solirubrobacterales bacterium]|jgi:isoleucyl-tRNA synthetase|nr:isoleucyl-tRNA synthetase [Solirubrobacterales bacterium]
MPGFRPVDTKQSFPELEERVLERWREREVFQRSLDQREGAPIWNFYEGPPTANGRPGSHHVLARVFKDVYPRYRSMCGYFVPRKAGWDCHGLPVEIEVEKQLGIASKQEIEDYGIDKFNQRCRESVFEYVEEWNRLTERIGFWIDLDHPYVTLDDDYIESVWWSLRQLWDKDRLYEGHKVVPYCPRCGTALSSHEVALGYQDVEDPSIYIKIPLISSAPATLDEPDMDPSSLPRPGMSGPVEYLLIWTTTPWTLPGNVAVAVAPEVTYVRARCGDEILILAEPLVERVLGEEVEVLERFPGAELVGRRYKGPIFELEEEPANAFRVVAGDFVTTEDGTGLVHIAPAFGEDDYAVAAANGIFTPTEHATLFNPVNLEGRFDPRVSGFEGKFVKDPEVTKALIADLERRGLLFREQVYEHAYPHCWRCGTPLLYYAKSSWYIATSQARDQMLANNEQIGWHPEHIKHGRFGKWLENNVDWALSRDRYWGTPLPIWRCTAGECTELYCAGSVAELRERAQGEVPEDLHRPYIDEVVLECGTCGGEMHRVDSVIDTWYDSGAMPFAQLHYPFENEELFAERFPADFICEAIDQTRGWFYTLLAESTLLFGTSSYRNCVCLGLILDPEGQKMSKSKGNVVEPWDVISAHGADAFRWYYLTAQQPWSGYRFSVDTVGESVRQFLLTLWNTYSFWVLYANAEGLGPADFKEQALTSPFVPDSGTKGEVSVGEDLDRWALSRLQATTATVRERMDDFDCTTAGRVIAEYVEELSNWYVRLSRRRFWEGDRAAFATLRHCLFELAALLAPFTPFLADEIHLNLAGGAGEELGDGPDSVHLRDFPQVDATLTDAELEQAMEAVRLTVELGRAARAQAKAKMRQPLRRAVIVANDAERAAIEARADLVTAELNVKELDFVSEESDLVSYAVKPNYRSLGPRFGKRMPQVAAAIEALDPVHVAKVMGDGGEIGINVDGHDHTIGSDEVILALQPLEGYEVEAEAGHAVALQLELDDELRREGLAREIVHAVQNARKAAGLNISDRIELTLGGDDELLTAARAHEPYIAGEVLATSITYDAGDGTAVRVDGRDLHIVLSANTAT